MYTLRAELRIHSADVRGVAASSAGVIATASRDHSVVIWDLDKNAPKKTLEGHKHFVNSLAFVGTNRLVSASGDNTLRVWDVDSGDCIHVLKGHTASVCSVSAATEGSTVVSASWDKTARVWCTETGECLRVLRGHDAAVWAAAQTASGAFITVGADKAVRIWPGHTKVETGTALQAAHSDVVRDLVQGPDGGFVTVANDSALVYWRESQDSYVPMKKVSDLHNGSFCYSVDSFIEPSGNWRFVTGGEDNAVRISECIETLMDEISPKQTIMHPGTVWSVCFCANGDIVTACSDGVARVFTTDESKCADQDVLQAFEKAVSERQINTKLIGGVDVKKLPSAEAALATPGKKDGENKIVKGANGGAEVYMWSSAESKWSKVGDVVEGPGGTPTGGVVNGKTYDFVFEVEIGEGGKKEKLGYNRGENPYLAAQRFIDENEISQEFLDQIAHFIEQQVPPEALQSTSSQLSDPLTGGSRYVPGGHAVSGGGSGDPFTGNHRYVPQTQRVGSSSSGSDPFTGGSRYVPGGGSNLSKPEANKLPPPRKLIPHKSGMVLYKNIDQIDKIQQKLSLFNTEFAQAGTGQALNQEEASLFGSSLMPKLKSRRDIVVLEENECALVAKILKWPTSHSFPVLDVARIAISIPSGAAYFFGSKNGEVLDDVLAHLSSEQANAAVYIMGCRFLCNMFGNRVSGTVAKAQQSAILQAASRAARTDNKRARETHAALLVNYAIMLHDSKAPAQERSSVIKKSVDVIEAGEDHEEVLYRVMIAIGTLICDDNESASLGVELGVAKAASDAAPISPRLQQIALEIATILAS
ncbi:Phospholipase A-2-activating protein [Gracilariopsis chorda]|uniref:Phospholipase A-2-activating protein n=1 Tax=Gracilariopsis chorda TaxID=448386 RepID=A0A2V3IH76_9FLOR|nr:Phospholipase A-2-activating protein [Gracilariopsis chorda]|eukprot:PXF41456.1 Phospholipase A-2-activating protein [Gracilariopsis chorda]